MTVNVTVLPETGGAPPVVRHAPPIISAAGVSDVSAISRQQLPSAVPAPALIPAYLANSATPPKPALRPTIAAPSSALAAQLIAQMPGISEEELAIFEPRAPLPQVAEDTAAPDDFLSALRAARGESMPTSAVGRKAATKTTTAVAQTQEVTEAAVAVSSKQAAAPSDALVRGSLTQLAASLPSLLSQFIRRPNIIQARGVSAYQLAEARNAANRNSTTTAAAL